MIETENGSIYTGVTSDLDKRWNEHCSGTGAKFFRSSPPKTLLYVEELIDKGAALKREYAIKQLSAGEKKELASG